jgi:hypothetical protein
MLARFPDWQSRLQAYLSALRNARFRYGVNDCCIFSCDAIRSMTGHDIVGEARGRYATRKAAMEAVRERTGGSNVTAFAEYTASELGMPSVPIAMAQRGDMVLVGSGSKAALGIVSLSGLDVMCLTRKGIVRVELKHVTAAWRV